LMRVGTRMPIAGGEAARDAADDVHAIAALDLDQAARLEPVEKREPGTHRGREAAIARGQ